MGHPGYLTRRDYVILAAAIVLLVPAVTLGFAYLGVAVAVLVFGALLFFAVRGIWTVATGRTPRLEHPLGRIQLSRLPARRPRIRHDRTIIVTEPEDDR